MFVRIAMNHYVPLCLIETLEFASTGIVARTKLPQAQTHSFRNLQVGLSTHSLVVPENSLRNIPFCCPCKIDSLGEGILHYFLIYFIYLTNNCKVLFKVPEFLPDVSGISLDASFSAVTVVSILLSPKIFFVIEILFAFLTSWKIPLSISVGL